MSEWRWNGSRWWRFDLHTHTPASDDYGRGPQQEQSRLITPRQWLLDWMCAEIDCVAITDHNCGGWIDTLKQALVELEQERPAEYRPIHLFPGVEISVNGGIHLLAVLPCDRRTADIDGLLGAVRFSGKKGSSDDVTSRTFFEVVNIIVAADGIAIPAHADRDSGVFTMMRGTTLEQGLKSKGISGMELADSAFQKPQLYADLKVKWTEVVGSDSHHPAGTEGHMCPGSRFSWVKMGSPTIEGLRLALLDGQLSVRRSDEPIGDLNWHAENAIESFEATAAYYMGRSQPFRIDMNPWLNTIIGGRGTGKSTSVEFLRLALRRTAELPKTLSADFLKYHKLSVSREDDGLLTDRSHFTVVYRKNGSRYRIQWNQTGNAVPIEVEQQDGTWMPEPGDIAQRFPVRIYSQKQVFELAKAPLALLSIVDQAPEIGKHSWQEKRRTEEAKYLSLRSKAREIQLSLADESRLQGELEDVRRKLIVFEKAGHADVLKDYQRRLKQLRAVELWETSWSGAGETIRQAADDIFPDPLDGTIFSSDAPEDASLLKEIAVLRTRFEQYVRELKRVADGVDGLFRTGQAKRRESGWRRAVDSASERYNELVERLRSEGAGEPSEYAELVKRAQALETRLEEMGALRHEMTSIEGQAVECFRRLVEIRRELTGLRRSFLDRALRDNRYVRIDLIPYGSRETVEADFRALVRRDAGVFAKDIGSPDTGGMLGDLYSGDCSQQVLEERLESLKARVHSYAKDEANGGGAKDRRFVEHIANLLPEDLDHLDLWFPEDSLKVQYSPHADGTEFRSIQEGSPGQKTAALLAFLLSYGEEPLVLDQPEDDLDNRLIYDLIVWQLRDVKQRRQIIVITHNANIVVNGDAELVVALVAGGGETHKECEGCLQERVVRDTICAIMEGGRLAFDQRYHRIVLEEHSV